MIKNKITYAALALFTLGLSACSQEEDSAPQGGEDEFHVITRSANGNANETFLRDFNLALWNQTDRSKYETHNMYIYRGEWKTKTLKSSILPTDVVAYTGIGIMINGYDNYSFRPSSDQSKEQDFNAADGMIATGTATKGGTLSLNFKHVFAKVQFNVTLGSEFTSSEHISKLSVAATGLSYFIQTYGEAKDEVYIAHTAAGTYSKDSVFAKIEIGEYTGDKALVVRLTHDLTLEAGVSYTFNLSVHKNKILLNRIDSHPFGNGWNDESELN